MKIPPVILLSGILLAWIPSAVAQRNNDWFLRQQQQQQIQRQQQEQMRRQQQEQQRRQQQEQLRRQQQQEAQRRAQQEAQRRAMQQAQQRQAQELQRQRMQEAQQQRLQQAQRQQMQNAQQRAAQTQLSARQAARRQAALGTQPNDRMMFSNGIGKLNRMPTPAEMKRGFTGKVTADGKAIVKVRGKIYAVPATRLGLKWKRPTNLTASGSGGDRPPVIPVAAAGAGGQRPPGGGGGWDRSKRAEVAARVQRLALLNAAALERARVRISAGAGTRRGTNATVAANDNKDSLFAPLYRRVVENFEPGYATRQLAEPTTFFRYHGEDNVTGRKVTWLTNKRYASEEELRQGLAIRKDWGISINSVSEIEVPRGERVVEGRAAAKGAGYPGGDYQAAIESDTVADHWIKKTSPAFN